MKRNDVGIRPSKHQVKIGNGTIIHYPLDTVKADKATYHHSSTVSIFDPHFLGYNGAAGKFECQINIGPVQLPQRKGRRQQYSRTQLQELQQM